MIPTDEILAKYEAFRRDRRPARPMRLLASPAVLVYEALRRARRDIQRRQIQALHGETPESGALKLVRKRLFRGYDQDSLRKLMQRGRRQSRLPSAAALGPSLDAVLGLPSR